MRRGLVLLRLLWLIVTRRLVLVWLLWRRGVALKRRRLRSRLRRLLICLLRRGLIGRLLRLRLLLRSTWIRVGR